MCCRTADRSRLENPDVRIQHHAPTAPRDRAPLAFCHLDVLALFRGFRHRSKRTFGRSRRDLPICLGFRGIGHPASSCVGRRWRRCNLIISAKKETRTTALHTSMMGHRQHRERRETEGGQTGVAFPVFSTLCLGLCAVSFCALCGVA